MGAQVYNTRGKCVDYKAISDIVLPAARQPHPQKSKLYTIKVIERDNETGKVEVYYTGYGSNHDEWKDEQGLEKLCGDFA